jgi:hypothetical protein
MSQPVCVICQGRWFWQLLLILLSLTTILNKQT